MKPTIKAKRWWWPPDRKKAKLANAVLQYQLNQARNMYIDGIREKLKY